mmetsp:Transcript_60386/g.112081  ORF Transcript_60386/g.112081 Transcript_60386/m.112081 type:complete len:94 (-) Transcript_60386:153-434(-)
MAAQRLDEEPASVLEEAPKTLAAAALQGRSLVGRLAVGPSSLQAAQMPEEAAHTTPVDQQWDQGEGQKSHLGERVEEEHKNRVSQQPLAVEGL